MDNVLSISLKLQTEQEEPLLVVTEFRNDMVSVTLTMTPPTGKLAQILGIEWILPLHSGPDLGCCSRHDRCTFNSGPVVLKGLYNASETQYPEKESARVAPHRENL